MIQTLFNKSELISSVIAFKGIPEVFELTIESGFLYLSILLNISFLTSKFSITTSQIQSKFRIFSKSLSVCICFTFAFKSPELIFSEAEIQKLSFQNIRSFRHNFEKGITTMRSFLGDEQHQSMIVMIGKKISQIL